MSQYTTEESNNENIVEQKKMNKHTFSILIGKGNIEFEEVQLNFYLYSDDSLKLEKLAKYLISKGYEMDVVEESSKNEFVLDGTSIGIKFSNENLNEWTTHMCNLGLGCDCKFISWGLKKKQKQLVTNDL
ncbi:ribonuclease E inhibitor RraB [Flavobacterium sp. KBS0721]|uniref:ribonuclease E inhibitor RraB n=1 Tax=Flavobacterium sp. KBS0721 TaxID=1179672 RepID=UPI00098F0D1F|nr:ribonuclease E inhibitor RraB [Flavobacterium sp. KBS0721]QDW21110.1 ribonuclease E inhibitor RraB [Flavobacterium sp. KBS0721]